MGSAKISVASLLVTGALVLAASAGAANDTVGGQQLENLGSAPGSYCKAPLSAVCSTVQPTKDGSGTFVLTVFAPSNTTIKHFDFWSGTPPTKLRPKAFCRSHGKDSAPQYQVGTYYITRCTETIKPNKRQTYCLSGVSRLPSTSGVVDAYSVYVDGGDAGASSSKGIPATSKCPASVAKRKRHKK